MKNGFKWKVVEVATSILSTDIYIDLLSEWSLAQFYYSHVLMSE